MARVSHLCLIDMELEGQFDLMFCSPKFSRAKLHTSNSKPEALLLEV